MGITNVYEKTEAQMTTKEKLERDKGLVLHLDFSTPYSADNLILDKSGNNNHATVVPSTAPDWIENGMIGKGAYSFDGSITNLISIPTSTITNFQDFTVSMWVNSSNLSKGINTIIHATNTGGNDFSIEMYSNRFVPLLLGNERIFYTSNSVNTWYHVALKRTGAVVEMFKDGVSLGTNAFNSTLLNITGAIILGQEQDTLGGGFDGNQAFEGLIDDVRIYSTALSASEVKELYQTRATVDEGGNLSVMGVNYGGNAVEIATNGVLNAKDFSEVGITDGLVAWYPLDGNARDYTMNRNDGTVNGASVAEGLGQGCYSFDGVNDYIDIPIIPNDVLDLKYDFTISLFFYAQTGHSNLSYFVGKGNTRAFSTQQYALASESNGFYVTKGGIYSNKLGIIVDNKWTMITGSATGGILDLYYDGEHIGSTIKSIPSPNSIYGQRLNIGRAPSGTDEYFKGLIQDVRIYNRALTQEEIKILYDLTKNKKTSFTSDGKVFIPGQLKEVY